MQSIGMLTESLVKTAMGVGSLRNMGVYSAGGAGIGALANSKDRRHGATVGAGTGLGIQVGGAAGSGIGQRLGMALGGVEGGYAGALLGDIGGSILGGIYGRKATRGIYDSLQAPDKKDPDYQKALSNAAIAGGAGLLAKPTLEGGLARMVGAQKFYHGTSNAAAKAIRESGLQPSFSGSGGATSPSLAIDSRRKVYIAARDLESKEYGQRHANTAQFQTNIGRDRTKFEHDLVFGAGGHPFHSGSLLEGYLPYSRFQKFDPDRNLPGLGWSSPEAIGPQHFSNWHNRFGKILQNRAHNVGQYIRENPGRAAAGAGLLAGGTALGGLAAWRLYRMYQAMKQRPRPEEKKAADDYEYSPLVQGFIESCRQEGLDDKRIAWRAKLACAAVPAIRDEFVKAGFMDDVVDAAHNITTSTPVNLAGTAASIGSLIPPLSPVALPIALGIGGAQAATGAAKQLNAGEPLRAAGNVASTALGMTPIGKHLPLVGGVFRGTPGFGKAIGQMGIQMAPAMVGDMAQDALTPKEAAEAYPGAEDMLSAFRSSPSPESSAWLYHLLHRVGQGIGQHSNILGRTAGGAAGGAALGYLLDNPAAGAGAGAGLMLGQAGGNIAGRGLGGLASNLVGRSVGIKGPALEKLMDTGSNWGGRLGGVTGAYLGGLHGYRKVRGVQEGGNPALIDTMFKSSSASPGWHSLQRMMKAAEGEVANMSFPDSPGVVPPGMLAGLKNTWGGIRSAFGGGAPAVPPAPLSRMDKVKNFIAKRPGRLLGSAALAAGTVGVLGYGANKVIGDVADIDRKNTLGNLGVRKATGDVDFLEKQKRLELERMAAMNQRAATPYLSGDRGLLQDELANRQN